MTGDGTDCGFVMTVVAGGSGVVLTGQSALCLCACGVGDSWGDWPGVHATVLHLLLL